MAVYTEVLDRIGSGMILEPRYTDVRAKRNACFITSVGVLSLSLLDVPVICFNAKRCRQAQGDADSTAPLTAPR
jgi:hypothetical protein